MVAYWEASERFFDVEDSNMGVCEPNVFENLKVIVFVSQVCGLIPRRPGGKFKKFVTFFHSMMMSAFYVYVCISFNSHVFERMQSAAANVKLLKKIIYVEITVRCVLLPVLLLLNLLKSDRFLKILHNLQTFDETLQRKMRAQIPLKQNLVLQCIYAAYVVFFVIYYGALLYTAKYGWRSSVLWAVSCNVNLVILLQFTVFVHGFGIRFKLFNNFLANVNTNTSFPALKSKTVRFRNLNTSALSQFELKELHIVYSSMRKSLQDINAYYSFQIFLIVSETVVILIGGISTVTFNITSDDYVIRSTYRYLTLIHCGLRLLSVTFLVYVAEKTSREANYTVMIIHMLLRSARNSEAKKGLHLFVLDLWHHKVKLKAHDLFDLDYHLIQSILSAAVTYIIVLIQFQLATTTVSSKSPST